MKPKYPLFIVSKGRWESNYTHKALAKMQVKHFMIVELQEYDFYKETTDEDYCTIMLLNHNYQTNYDTCDNLGDNKSKGAGASRNYAWDVSMQQGFDYHWVMDDNIRYFARYNNNTKSPVADGTIFRCMEDFVERYSNVTMAGPNYEFFVPRKKGNKKRPPYFLNTRIYSCNLIKNNVPYRWRGRYNEDTDLSLRMLKDGNCTILFNAFLQKKLQTQIVSGGNTKDFYETEGTKPKSNMQVNLHPDVSKEVIRFGRPHNYVDYSSFKKNKLKRKDNNKVYNKVDNYGMRHQVRNNNAWIDAK